MLKRMIIVLAAILAVAGCGASHSTSNHTAEWVAGYNAAASATDSGGAIFEANLLSPSHLTRSGCKSVAANATDAANVSGLVSNYSQWDAGYYAGCLAFLKANHWLN